MPHLIIEYSEALSLHIDKATLMRALCNAVADSGIARREDLKVRMTGYADVLLNDGSGTFMHLTLSLLAGRSPEEKERLGVICRASLVDSCPAADAISVEIRDMDPRSYKKRVRA